MSRRLEKVFCESCGNEFDKESRYVKAAEKKGRKHFCGISCHTTFMNENVWNTSQRNKENNKNLPQCQKGYKQKNTSPFTWYVARARSRKKNNGVNTDMLKELWESQKGLCAISNLPIILHDECKDNRYLASLDRIDSSLPYQEGNLQFIALPLNLAKQSFDNKEFISFLKEVSASL